MLLAFDTLEFTAIFEGLMMHSTVHCL